MVADRAESCDYATARAKPKRIECSTKQGFSSIEVIARLPARNPAKAQRLKDRCVVLL